MSEPTFKVTAPASTLVPEIPPETPIKTAEEPLIPDPMGQLQDGVREEVAKHPSVIQFKNALEYIQTGTGMTLDRMKVTLENLCQTMVLMGMNLENDRVRNMIKEVKEKEGGD